MHKHFIYWDVYNTENKAANNALVKNKYSSDLQSQKDYFIYLLLNATHWNWKACFNYHKKIAKKYCILLLPLSELSSKKVL